MRREEARRNKYCLNKSNLVYVEETEDKKSSDKKASEVIEVVFGRSTFILDPFGPINYWNPLKWIPIIGGHT